MATAPRNIAVPAFLLVIFAFLLLISLMVWFWDSADDPSVIPPEVRTGIEEGAGRQSPAAQALTDDGEETDQQTTATDLPGLPAVTEAEFEQTATVGDEQRVQRIADEPSGTLERQRAGASGAGQSGSPPSSRRQAPDDGGTKAGSLGSTFVAIPAEQPPATIAPPQSKPAAEREEEIPIEEEEIPEPLSESPSPDELERPEPEPRDEPPDSRTVVQLIPNVAALSVGDHLAAVVMISGASDIGHVPFHLLYNSQVLLFEYGEEGLFLGGDGRQTAFFAASASGGGAVVVGLSRMGGGDGISGGGQLCTLHFTAIGPGAAGFAFSREKVRDSGNRIMPAFFMPAAVIVQE